MEFFIEKYLAKYPNALFRALAAICSQRRIPFYISGGTVRDWLRKTMGNDLDITVPADGYGCAMELARLLGGSFVGLDEKEDVARVVWQGISIDISGFREGTKTIEDDLLKRDFTINGLAIPFDSFRPIDAVFQQSAKIIDPAGGIADLQAGVIRCTSDRVFRADPLRLLRAYRFAATLGFSLEPHAEEIIRQNVTAINKVAAERLAYELELIIAADSSHQTFKAMHANGLLQQLFPELVHGVGVEQPASHHLDVFDHSIAALECMEQIILEPDRFFPESKADMVGYLQTEKRRNWLKWASLFHDLGKPETRKIREEKGGRITFYNHDRAGARQFREIAGRFKWSREDTNQVARFIEMHMWPFHLSNSRRRQKLTPKAYLRLAKAADSEMNGLFLLAMADSLAGQGTEKPQAMEESLASLFVETRSVYQKSIKPVLESPSLLSGHDLQKYFSLTPGPIFREILDGLQEAQVAGEVRDKDDAVTWVKIFLKEKK